MNAQYKIEPAARAQHLTAASSAMHRFVVRPPPALRQSAADVINDVKYEFKGAFTLLHKPTAGLQRPPYAHTRF